MNSEDNIPQIKSPTTYKEQVKLFEKRNMYINNSENAEKILQRINYYRLSAYGLTLKDQYNKDQYLNGSTFNKMYSLYEFDRKLRLLLMGVLESIEIALRTHISYEIGQKFGSLGYKDNNNFISEKFHQDSLDELDSLTQRSRKGELFIEHHYRKYGGNLPIWVALEITSFGFLSKFYRNLNEDVKKHIAKVYYDVPYLYLESWLQTLSNVRNVCAHYGRLYNKNLTFKPRLFRKDIKKIDNSFIFAAIYITHRLLTKTDRIRFITDLDALISEYGDSLEFRCIGFPLDWKEVLLKVNSKK